jgi:hypothetical protein
MIIRAGVMIISLGALLDASSHDSLASDYLEQCISPDGKEYYVDANTQHCPVADRSTRCAVPNAPVIHTRGREECLRKGGWPLGEPRPAGWPDRPKNSN